MQRSKLLLVFKTPRHTSPAEGLLGWCLPPTRLNRSPRGGVTMKLNWGPVTMYLNSTLALTVVGDQAVAFGGVIPRALKGMRVERVCSIVRDRASAGALPRRRGRAE
jgi:hypothetical protein